MAYLPKNRSPHITSSSSQRQNTARLTLPGKKSIFIRGKQMTIMSGNFLRNPEINETMALLPDMEASELTVQNVSIRRMRDSGSPVFFFDVIDRDGEKVGIASLVDEEYSDAVRDYGHVCVTLSEVLSHELLLAEIAREIFKVARGKGLARLRLVVPPSHGQSINACLLLQPEGEAETLEVGGKNFLAFHYGSPA